MNYSLVISLIMHGVLFGLVFPKEPISKKAVLSKAQEISLTFKESSPIAKACSIKRKSPKKNYRNVPLPMQKKAKKLDTPPSFFDTKAKEEEVSLQEVEASQPSLGRLTPVLLNGADVKVPYPKKARHFKIQGVVRLRLTISDTGEVLSAEVLQGPSFDLSKAAVSLARKLYFLPATDQWGHGRIAYIEHEVIFKLTNVESRNLFEIKPLTDKKND